MTSKKRKSSLPETPAKRRKFNKEVKSPLATSKKRNGVANKSKPCSTQRKSKTALPTNKANKKLHSSRSEVGQKKKTGNVKVIKKSNLKNVPAKQKALAKDMAASKKSTPQKNNASKATKKAQPTSVRKTAARGTSTKSKMQKIVKSPARSQSAKRIKNEPVKKSLSKPGKKSIQAKKVAKKVDKTVKSKEKKPSKTTPSKNKQTVVNLKRTAESIRKSERSTKSDSKRDTSCASETTKKMSSTRRTNQKPSIALKQKTRIVDKKKPGTTPINVAKKQGPRVKKIKTGSPEDVGGQSLVHQTIQPVIPSGDSVKNKTREEGQSTSCSTSNVAKHTLVKEKISSKPTTPSTRTSTVPLKRKRDSNIPLKTANKAKKQKVSKPGSAKNNVDVPTENEQKSKRISILDLCNEIAGEIESDTVEVVKEAPSTPDNSSEDKPFEEKKDSPMEASLPPPSEHSPIMPSRRFFPSRKPLQMKSKVDQKTNSLTKKSKWHKIKPKKNFAPNNILRSHTALPNLESIRAKASIQQTVMEAMNTPMTSNKKTDASLSKDIKLNDPVLSERMKNNTVPSVEGESEIRKQSTENGLLGNHIKHELEIALDEGFRLHLDSSPENSPVKNAQMYSTPVTRTSEKQRSDGKQLTDQMAASADRGNAVKSNVTSAKSNHVPSDAQLQKEIRKLKEADKDSSSQPIIDAGQKRFGAITCNVCGMLYTASNPEDETQHLLFHNQFISAVKYVGWKKERIVAEYPDGKIIMILPDDPKYALKKVEEIREMVDNDLGFQQVPLRIHSRTKTFLFINGDKKVVGCLIAEHIQWGYRVIEDNIPSDNCDKDQIISERVKAWCCSTTPEPAICGVSRIWVFSMMRRKKIASRMLECLRNHFIYGSHLSKDEIAFSDPTPDGKLFATHYCGTGQFLVYNFVSGHPPLS